MTPEEKRIMFTGVPIPASIGGMKPPTPAQIKTAIAGIDYANQPSPFMKGSLADKGWLERRAQSVASSQNLRGFGSATPNAMEHLAGPDRSPNIPQTVSASAPTVNRPLGRQGDITSDTQPAPNPFLNQPIKKESYLKPGKYGQDTTNPIVVTDENGTQVVRGPAIKRPQNTTITYAQEPDYLEPVFYKGKRVGETIQPGRTPAPADAGGQPSEPEISDRWKPAQFKPLEQERLGLDIADFRARTGKDKAEMFNTLVSQIPDMAAEYEVEPSAAQAMFSKAWQEAEGDPINARLMLMNFLAQAGQK